MLPLMENRVLLYNAVYENDFDTFEKIIRINEGIITEKFDGSYLTVFEICCQRPGMQEFIELCVKKARFIDIINLYVRCIHLAAASRDAENLRVLFDLFPKILHGEKVDVNLILDGQTALSKVIAGLGYVNFEGSLAVIRLLLERGADVNIADCHNVPPILRLLRATHLSDRFQARAIKLLLNERPHAVDVDSHWNGEARQLLQSQHPDLLDLVKPADDAELDLTAICMANDEKNPMLVMTEQLYGWTDEIQGYIDLTGDYRYHWDIYVRACQSGRHDILKRLLKKSGDDPELASMCLVFCAAGPQSKDVFTCCIMLLDVEDIDVNYALFDDETALHVAVERKNYDIVKLLLRNDAQVGIFNEMGEIHIKRIDPDILSEYLSECIIGSANDEIVLNYGNFAYNANRVSEMCAIQHMIKSRELRHLVKHPLISSYLFLKRCQLWSILKLNLATVITIYVGLMLTHMLWPQAIVVPAIFGAIYIVLRETIKLLALPAHFARILNTYIALLLAVLTIVLLVDHFSDKTILSPTYRRPIVASTILLAGWELLVTLGEMTLSTQLEMLLKVAHTVGKSLIVYLIILLAFAMCFQTLLGHHIDASQSEQTSQNSTNDDNEETFNKFGTLDMAFVRTVVMLTGEFEAGNIASENIFTRLVFMLFVMFVTIVMFNLLTGLAVSDTQQIQKDAEINYWIRQAEILIQYEKMFSAEGGGYIYSKMRSFLFKRIKLVGGLLPCGRIRVSSDNFVSIFHIKYDDNPTLWQMRTIFLRLKVKAISRLHNYRMESHIMNNIREIVKRRQSNVYKVGTNQENKASALEQSVTKIEGRVDAILNRMEETQANNSRFGLRLDTLDAKMNRMQETQAYHSRLALMLDTIDAKMNRMEESLGKQMCSRSCCAPTTTPQNIPTHEQTPT